MTLLRPGAKFRKGATRWRRTGPGGQYAPSAQVKLPLEATATIGTTTVDNLNTTQEDIRRRENDNLSSFAAGPLD